MTKSIIWKEATWTDVVTLTIATTTTATTATTTIVIRIVTATSASIFISRNMNVFRRLITQLFHIARCFDKRKTAKWFSCVVASSRQSVTSTHIRTATLAQLEIR